MVQELRKKILGNKNGPAASDTFPLQSQNFYRFMMGNYKQHSTLPRMFREDLHPLLQNPLEIF
jgi:hypothetical protein